MVAFYNAKDQAIYNAGDKFIPQTKYLQSDYIPTEGISYEGDGSPVSYAKSGIMTEAPIIYPPVNQGGGDDGGPYIIPKDDDDDDKTYTGSSMSPLNVAKEAGKMFLMGGPQAYIMQKLISKGIGAFKDYRNKNKVEKYTGQEMSSYRDDRPSSEKNYTGGDTNSNPSTPGAQDSFSNKSGMGRTGYFYGGRVNYKAGGRTDAESQYGADSAGSYDSSQNKSGRQQSYGGNDTKQPALLVKKVDTIDTSGLKSKSPEINIDYTDPRNYASLKGSIYNTNILDNDDINVDGTLSGDFGPVSYNTNFTDQGITGTNLTAGNFSADIDANKNYSLGYTNNYNGIDYGAKYDNDGNLMFNAGVTFKNGGLAGLI